MPVKRIIVRDSGEADITFTGAENIKQLCDFAELPDDLVVVSASNVSKFVKQLSEYFNAEVIDERKKVLPFQVVPGNSVSFTTKQK